MQFSDDTTWIPQLGMEFQTEEEAWQFWKIYSAIMGFGVRKRYGHKSRIDGTTTSIVYVCSNEGHRAKDKRDALTKNPRPETRTSCQVRLGVKFIRETNRFKVTNFIPDHNHRLLKPEACHCSQRVVPEAAVYNVDELAEETGIPPKQKHELIGRQTSGPTHFTFSITDHRNVSGDKHQRVLTEPKLVDNENDIGGLRNDIRELWEKGEIFDVTFEVEGERICAHSFMLAARSPVFKTLLFGPMAEAKSECIKIDEMKAEVFKALLHFIYTDKLAKGETPSIELHRDLFKAAGRFSLNKLTLLCEKHLEMNMSVDTVVTTLHLADQHRRAGLKKKCLEFASSPENFCQVALTQGYLSIMPRSPSLLAELIEEVNSASPYAKKQRTG